MKRRSIIIAAAAIAAVVAATPWATGRWVEHLLRARVAQVEVDKSTRVLLNVDRYERGWQSANARFSVVDRNGTTLLTVAAVIRHWPFTSAGPAEWDAVPELGDGVRQALAPWGTKLPELTTHTRLSWRGDVLTQIETQPFKRRVPEVAGGTLEIAAIAGTVDWRRDGALAYDIALPGLHVERLAVPRAEAMGIIEWKDVVLKGNGWLGTVERQWNQAGSLAAASVTATEAAVPVLSATAPVIAFASREEDGNVGIQIRTAAATFNAKNALQDLSDAAVELTIDLRHLARAPLDRLLDATRRATDRESLSESVSAEMLTEVLRGSPAADVRFASTAREGRVELKLALAFDGTGMEPKVGSDAWQKRLGAQLDARASLALVVRGARAGTKLATDMLASPSSASAAAAMPDVAPPDADAVARQRLAQAAAQGWIRIEGDEAITSVVWRNGRLTVNGQDMSALRDLAQGLSRR